ncbi:MAG: phenylalanine--tRNA ligase beta subunit-related protein [Bacteroidota bacterium]
MQQITIASGLSAKVPGTELSCIECDVQIIGKNEQLWNEILLKIEELSAQLAVEQISKLPAVATSRRAYKACGKDPARYRLSAEALLRRVVKRNEIYQVNNVVDLLNLVSISTGFSIGGYDASKIEGDVEFGIGQKDELYEGIGRGELNIEFMPVFRDEAGAFGTPTSDSVRTRVSESTVRFLTIIIDYGTNGLLLATTEMAKKLLEKYANATNFELRTIKMN